MGVYDRTKTLSGEIAEIEKNVTEIKQAQIIGNDNLVINGDEAVLFNQTLTAATTAIFKFTYTFNEPSNSYVLPRFRTENQPSNFNAVFYADPSTVDDLTKKSWFYSITTTSTVNNVILLFRPLCSDLGTATIVRTV